MVDKDTLKCPFEHIKNPGLEKEKITEIADRTVGLLDKRYLDPDKILRGVHPKSHGCVKAIFEINSDIDQSLQIGLFSTPQKKYDAFIRFSNAEALLGPDINSKGEHGSRGMAIKIFNVGNEVLTEDQGQYNQDFLMINQPVFAFANTDDYLRLTRILDRNNDSPDKFFLPLNLKNPALSEQEKQKISDYVTAENIDEEAIKRIEETLEIVKLIKSSAVANPLNIQYFSAAPFLFGQDRVMKFSVNPVKQTNPTDLPPNPSANYLQAALTESMSQNESIEFNFMVQVRSGEDDMGIENASSIWDENQFPFINVAKITIPAPQLEINSDENKAYCEALAYTPWHSLPDHQPLGSINRLRKEVYQASAEHRSKEREKGGFILFQLIKKLLQSFLG